MSGPGGDAAHAPSDLVGLEVVRDKTAGSLADSGFLRVRRLVLRNVYRDGTRSADYDCDVMSRARTDAVAAAVFEVRGAPGSPRVPWVLLKTGVRPPVWLRRGLRLVQPDTRPWGLLPEVVAGMLEPGDTGPRGIERRAVSECLEEAGLTVDERAVRPLGAESFPSPGVTDEKVHFRAVEADLSARVRPTGDGSPMEEGGTVVVWPLSDAIEACRTGKVPDMKTEVALLRLADAIGYVPQLQRFVDDLPADLRAAWRPLAAGSGASGA
ncbi:MAG TPA: NUDIX hydrolase [Planctomycetota bacterium]|nr:NUDIX hydrolase [Planctomycetota bacterium]